MRCAVLVGWMVFAAGGPLFADGLAYRLPPDGTWVKYRITVTRYQEWTLRPDETEGWVLKKEPEPTPEELARESRDNCLLVRTVGQRALGDKPCRWVELVLNSAEEGKPKPEARVIVLNVLI